MTNSESHARDISLISQSLMDMFGESGRMDDYKQLAASLKPTLTVPLTEVRQPYRVTFSLTVTVDVEAVDDDVALNVATPVVDRIEGFVEHELNVHRPASVIRVTSIQDTTNAGPYAEPLDQA